MEKLCEEVISRIRANAYEAVFLGGPSGGGKSSLAQMISERLPAVVVSLDDYYLNSEHVKFSRSKRFGKALQWDRPESVDLRQAAIDIGKLAAGGAAEIPSYSFSLSRRIGYRRLDNHERRTVVIEGLHALLLREQIVGCSASFGVFISARADVRRSRIVVRDSRDRDRPTSDFVRRFHFIEIAERRWISPQRGLADLVIDTSCLG